MTKKYINESLLLIKAFKNIDMRTTNRDNTHTGNKTIIEPCGGILSELDTKIFALNQQKNGYDCGPWSIFNTAHIV